MPVPSSGSNQMQARLGRVEELIEQMGNRAAIAHTSYKPARDLSEGHMTQLGSRSLEGCTDDYCAGIPTPAASAIEASASFSGSSGDIVVRIFRLQALAAIVF